MDKRVAEYRQKARECRKEAMRTSHSKERAKWLELADQWEVLARALENEIKNVGGTAKGEAGDPDK